MWEVEKTLVALMSMLMALDNGYQACMMALPKYWQTNHYETIRELLYGMDVRVELLTGSIKGKRREAILSGLLTGDVQILIGTHAVIEDTVNFASLGLVVIDEQHRFGVAQRARLVDKKRTAASYFGHDRDSHTADSGNDALWRSGCIGH